MAFEPWMLAAIDQAGYNDITESHIKAVAIKILETGITHVARQDFKTAYHRFGIDPDNFTQEDLNRLESHLNR